MGPPRAPTAYFTFAAEVRAEVTKQVIEQSENGKLSVAAIGKEIGQRWAKLTDEEKQKYKDIAAQRGKELKEQYEKEQAEKAAAGNASDGEDAEGDGPAPTTKAGPPPPPFGLPTSLIKKIACMDPDVDRMSADAVRALSKATTLFIEMLAENALDNARHMKRKNFKFSDIEDTARLDRRLVDMGLAEMLENDSVFAEIREKLEEENKNRQANKAAAHKEQDAGKGMKNIASFFGGAPSGGAGPSSSKPDVGAADNVVGNDNDKEDNEEEREAAIENDEDNEEGNEEQEDNDDMQEDEIELGSD